MFVLFPTVEFAAFFAIVLVLNWVLMPRPALWKPFIILASYVCYGWASWHLVLVLVGVTLFNQLGAYVVGARIPDVLRKLALGFWIAGDLSVLVYAKYVGFFATQIDAALDRIGIGGNLPIITVGATVGISFYTFQGISYVVDCYRGTIQIPARTIDFMAYQAFFPHLFAGPIVRAVELLPQLEKPRRFADVPVVSACLLILRGLVEKLLIADVLGKLLVDPVYTAPDRYAWWEILVAVYGYAAQIYADFAGYTNMAIGLAALLGFRFPINFDRPYASTTLQEFWRRWHISLSSWLRDYLYIPLGGSRRHVYRNLMLTMLLGGLWHGANWTFVVWGGIHGSVQCAERRLGDRWRAVHPVVRWLVIFHVVALAWVFFRAQDFGNALSVLRGLVPDGVPASGIVTLPILALVAMGTVLQVIPTRRLGRVVVATLESLRPATLGVAFAVMLTVLLAVLPNLGTPAFIYFQF